MTGRRQPFGTCFRRAPRNWCRHLSALLPLLLFSHPAAAQSVEASYVSPSLPIEFDRGRNIGVLDRSRPEFEAAGIRLGAWVLRPRAEIKAGWTDNVYQSIAKTGDGYFEISPSGTMTSDWTRHEFGVDAGGVFRRYFSESPRNQDGWHLNGHGRIDFGVGDAVLVSAGHELASEPVTSISYPGSAAEASQYQRTRIDVTPTITRGSFKLQVSYEFSQLQFSPVITFAGTMLDQANRNSTTHQALGRVEYALTPDTSIFVQGGYDVVSYQVDLATGVPNRDSHSYRVLVGASFDLASRLRGAVGAGYMARDYRSALYSRVAGLSLEARIDWFVDNLTTVTATARRILEDASFNNSGGYVNTSIALRADHELFRNILLDAQIGFERDAFQQAGASARILRLSGGARYLMNREIGIGLSIQHDQRHATASLGFANFDETRAVLSFVLQR